MMKTGNWKPFSIILLVLLLSLIPVADADCLGEIINVVAIIDGDDLEAVVFFKNTGQVLCEFRVFLLNSNGDVVDKEPDLYWGNFDPGEIGSYTVSGSVDEFADGTYRIELRDQHSGVVDDGTETMPIAGLGFSVHSATCACYGQGLEASGSSLSAAEYQCGAYCGGLTHCGKGGEECDSCCTDYCRDADLSNENETKGCINSCKNSCGSNRFFHDLAGLFIAITLVIAVVILTGCGLRFITSDDLEARKKAKRCLIYVIAALIILGLAGAIIDMVYEPSGGPGGTTTTTLIEAPCSHTTLETCEDGGTCWWDDVEGICNECGTAETIIESCGDYPTQIMGLVGERGRCPVCIRNPCRVNNGPCYTGDECRACDSVNQCEDYDENEASCKCDPCEVGEATGHKCDMSEPTDTYVTIEVPEEEGGKITTGGTMSFNCSDTGVSGVAVDIQDYEVRFKVTKEDMEKILDAGCWYE